MNYELLYALFKQKSIAELEAVCPEYDLVELNRRLRIRSLAQAKGGKEFRKAHANAMLLVDVYPVEDILDLVPLHARTYARALIRVHTHA